MIDLATYVVGPQAPKVLWILCAVQLELEQLAVLAGKLGTKKSSG